MVMVAGDAVYLDASAKSAMKTGWEGDVLSGVESLVGKNLWK
jgi:hypothetical protein